MTQTWPNETLRFLLLPIIQFRVAKVDLILLVVIMPSFLRPLILLILFVGFASIDGHTYDEARSVSLINQIDRHHRSIGDELTDDQSLLGDHGHIGNDHEDFTATAPFTNEWVVEIKGGADAAARLAEEMGFEIHGEVKHFFLEPFTRSNANGFFTVNKEKLISIICYPGKCIQIF